MAWGERKPEGNIKAQLPSGFLSPQAVHAGPLNSNIGILMLIGASTRPEG
jgi:hypothetical protein